jgi:hypothetical protein
MLMMTNPGMSGSRINTTMRSRSKLIIQRRRSMNSWGSQLWNRIKEIGERYIPASGEEGKLRKVENKGV